MDIARLTSFMLFLACSPGCSMYYSGVRTLLCEPLHYCAPKDNCFATIRNRIVAEVAWRDLLKAQPEQRYSEDHADGFKHGYADYLYAGGNGAPPPLPPRHYWRKTYQTPEGHQQILDWYAGFRQGAMLAQSSGQRELVTVPTSVFTGAAPGHLRHEPLQSSGGLSAPPVEMISPPTSASHAGQADGFTLIERLPATAQLPALTPEFQPSAAVGRPFPVTHAAPQGMAGQTSIEMGFHEPVASLLN